MCNEGSNNFATNKPTCNNIPMKKHNLTFSLVDEFLGISKNSKSICNKAFCKTTKRWYRDCCSSYWYGWTDKGMGLTFNFMNLLNFMESYIAIVPNTDRHLLSM